MTRHNEAERQVIATRTSTPTRTVAGPARTHCNPPAPDEKTRGARARLRTPPASRTPRQPHRVVPANTAGTTPNTINPSHPANKPMTNKPPDPHAILGVLPTATHAEITHAYRTLLRQHHLDTRAPARLLNSCIESSVGVSRISPRTRRAPMHLIDSYAVSEPC